MKDGAARQQAGIGPGTKLGRYEILVPIAQGGMATVWAARLRGSRGFEKLFAIKTMLPGMTDDPKFEKMFLAEAGVASRIRHPNVVEVLELGEEAGVLYLVLEWIDGEPLSEIIKASAKKEGIPLRVAVNLVMQICAGLHAAHELKDENGSEMALVHRDISPQNILVSYEGVAKVADFGIAKAMARGESTTQLREVKGKIAYLSPEQASRRDVDRRSDIFAIGILLYQLATGRHPFRGETDGETVANILISEPIHGYPRQLENVLKRCLAKEPDERYATASAMRKALQTVLPPQQRVTGYEEIADFLKMVLGDSFTTRRQKFTAAIRAATEPTDIAINDNATMTLTDVAPTIPVSRRKQHAFWAAGAALVLVTGSLVAFSAQKDETADVEQASLPAPKPPAPVPVASKPPDTDVQGAAAPSAASTQTSPAPATKVPSEPGSPKRIVRRIRPKAAPTPPKTSTSSARTGGSTLSPVRTPGF